MSRRSPVVPGTLYLVGTPIGNLEDLTFRAARVLAEVALVAAEDTRAAAVLLRHLDIKQKTVSLFDANEGARTPMLLERLRSGDAVAVISEAGMPCISDPGHLLVRQAIEAGLQVDVIPGPSAVTTALLHSGFGPAHFRFVGFLPRKGAARRRQLESLSAEQGTTILFEAPGRVVGTLRDVGAVVGDRAVAVARELTKLHQQVLRGSVEQLLARLGDQPIRGEVTIVVSPASAQAGYDEAALETEVAERVAAGLSAKDIAAQLSGAGRSKRVVYQLALTIAKGTGRNR